jgi:Asp-tRNA(Asn)/Glu-tRNA(Gln) amidotransferase A subunit family amidase
VRTIIRNSFKEASDQYDILISPAVPSVVYKIGKHMHIFPFALLHFTVCSNCFIVFDICR